MKKQSLLPYVSLFLIIFLIYSNSLSTPWQLDDPPNITNNSNLHITNLEPETIWQTFFARPFSDENLYRPIANLSFALNWYVGQSDPFGYHIFNLLIHILTAFFLFKSSKHLLVQSSSRKQYTSEAIIAIALLSTTLWAINPIQTQAVTYIVQRMASMAGMFFIVAIYHYISARKSSIRSNTVKHFLFCLFSFILAIGCKENAITLIPALLLIEIFFFLPQSLSKKVYHLLLAANIILLGIACYYIISHDYLTFLTSNTGSRPFSVLERLLTQPAILFFYISLIFYPSPERLSIDHSFPISTSLFSPWYTLPAILLVILLIIFAVKLRRKNPLLGFAILFFFVTHVVESSIIPLEMVFEHRNYIPSFFLFLPVSAGMFYLVSRFRYSSKILYGIILFTLASLVIVVGIGTYSRNEVWRSEESLWADTLKKASDNARPFAKLGEIYGWQKEKNSENLRIAIGMLDQALNKTSPRTSFKPAIMGNIAKVYRNYGMLDEAVEYYQKSLEMNPKFLSSRFDLAETLTLQGKFTTALDQLEHVISQNDEQSRFFNLKAALLLWLDRPQEATVASANAMHRTIVNKERYFYNTGVALGRAGHFSQGSWFLRLALQRQPGNMRVILSLIENRLLARDSLAVKEFSLQLLDNHGLSAILSMLEHMRTDYSSAPVDDTLIRPILLKLAKQQVTSLSSF